MILVTGVTGTIGRPVLEEVRKSGKSFKALVRSAEDARKLPGGTPTAVGDFASKESLNAALHGIDIAYLVCSPIPQLVDLESNVIDASLASGVKHIVLNSALGASDYPKSFPSWHKKVEDKLESSGLGYTIIRPNGFMQNILAYLAPSIRAQGAIYAAMGNARTSYLDVADIAVVIAKALLSPADHAGKVYELNGPESVSYTELAQRISRVANREIKFVDIPESAQRQTMLGLGMPEWQVNALLELQQFYVAGRGGDVTPVLATLLARAPVKLDDFLQRNRDEFRSQTAKA
jgi:uncharacterized protein YbjT (DUF2867 family)